MGVTRDDVLAELTDELLGLNPAGRVMVAIDGIDGAGKTRFADAWAEALRARHVHTVRASIDGFHRPRIERYARGRDSGEGYYRDSFDLTALRDELLVPFRSGAERCAVSVFDYRVDGALRVEAIDIPERAVLLVDGVFVHRPELAGLWHHSVWLEVPESVTAARLLERDGPASLAPRYAGGQSVYRAEVNPRRRATIVIDNSDPAHPHRLFDDFC